MDGLSAAASVIAVIQVSSQIFDSCRTYYINVKDARKDIQRLRNEITALQDVLVNVADLADNPNSSSLKTLSLISQEDGPLQHCQSELMILAARLEPGEEKGRMSQFGMRALKWPFSSKEVDKILDNIGRHKSSFTLALAADQTALALSIAQGVSDITQKLNSQKVDEDRGEIIQWLSTTDPSTNHHAACEKCQLGSGKWLLERSEFKHWQTTENSFLWLHGIPGSGKTILSSTVIEELRVKCNSRPNTALAYFYFDFNTTAKQELPQCLSSIVAQLYSQMRGILEEIRKSYERCSYGKHRPSVAELKDMFSQASKGLDDVFVVLDALDECPRYGERAPLLAAISDIMTPYRNIHIFATSRREPDIEEALMPLLSFPAISLEGSELDFDIKMYISCQLATDSSLKKWSREIKTEIGSSLTMGANGMFRWVDCQLSALRRCLKVSLIREALRNLPKTLDETYSRVFSAIEEGYRDDARNALIWLAFSERPLKLTELAEATIIHPYSDPPFDPEERFPDPQNVLEILSSLVTVNYLEHSLDQAPPFARNWDMDWSTYISRPDSRNTSSSVGLSATITLAHYTVKEYLTSERIKDSLECHFSAPIVSSNMFIVESCLHYILYCASLPTKLLSPSGLQTFPLLRYAAGYWYTHIHLIPYDRQKVLNSLVLKLLLSERYLRAWLHFQDQQTSCITLPEEIEDGSIENALFYAVDIGLIHVAQELINKGWDLNVKDAYSESALHRVAREGNVDMALLLLKNGAAVDATNDFDQTPLHLAAWSEYEDVVDLLQDWGADINARNQNGETALHYATTDSTEMLKHLLERGASFEVHTIKGQSPVDWAVNSGSTESIDVLVKAGAVVVRPPWIPVKQRDHTALEYFLLERAAELHKSSRQQDSLIERRQDSILGETTGEYKDQYAVSTFD